MAQLKRIQFGNPLLRQTAGKVTAKEMQSSEFKTLIADMQETLTAKKLGIGLAAPQVGRSLALAIIKIQPTKHRPAVEPFELVMVNPKITKVFGRRIQQWEGCISTGSSGKADLFAKVPRFKKIQLSYMDEQGKQHDKTFEGLRAHVIQHEVDHLNGVLFVDRVKDTKTYMTYKEYLQHVKWPRKGNGTA